jgi:hypothetical protein
MALNGRLIASDDSEVMCEERVVTCSKVLSLNLSAGD